MLIYIKAVSWPVNHPGCTATAPPRTGQYVRLVETGRPPPDKGLESYNETSLMGSCVHGYVHCMPKGNSLFVLRVFPRHPGYVMTVCAVTSWPANKPYAKVDAAEFFMLDEFGRI
jgi:hypothetical protein